MSFLVWFYQHLCMRSKSRWTLWAPTVYAEDVFLWRQNHMCAKPRNFKRMDNLNRYNERQSKIENWWSKELLLYNCVGGPIHMRMRKDIEWFHYYEAILLFGNGNIRITSLRTQTLHCSRVYLVRSSRKKLKSFETTPCICRGKVFTC